MCSAHNIGGRKRWFSHMDLELEIVTETEKDSVLDGTDSIKKYKFMAPHLLMAMYQLDKSILRTGRKFCFPAIQTPSL